MTFTRRAWSGFALGAAFVLAACGGGAEGEGGANVRSTRQTTTTESPTATTAAVVESTPGPRSVEAKRFTRSADTDLAPVQQNPAAAATPARAAVGDMVRLEGGGFVGEPWNAEDAPLYLVGGSDDCALYAIAHDTLVVDDQGRLGGSFVVPGIGDCRMAGREAAVTPGRYQLAYSCTACVVGEIEVVAAR